MPTANEQKSGFLLRSFFTFRFCETSSKSSALATPARNIRFINKIRGNFPMFLLLQKAFKIETFTALSLAGFVKKVANHRPARDFNAFL